MMKGYRILVLLAVIAMMVAGSPARGAETAEGRAQREGRLQWYRQAKFGLFIHWGLYAIPAGEWKGQKIQGIGEWIMNRARIPVKEYEPLARQFNPVKFKAAEWVGLAKEAGMKYIVITSKHHDGFAMFRSRVSPYNIFEATPFQRDPIGELAEACRKEGIRLGFYYSQAQDWHEPGGAGNDWDFPPNERKDFDKYLREKALPQVNELLTGYGPVALIWFDTPVLMTPGRCQDFITMVRTKQPDCLINSRVLLRSGPDREKLDAMDVGEIGCDYKSRPDNEVPPKVLPGDWETPATLNDTWGFKKDDNNWKPVDELVFKLVDIVSKGGNYLLNVGPTSAGVIPEPSQERLRAVGRWLKVNGEAIYGAGPTPFGPELGDPTPVADAQVPKGKKGKKGAAAYTIRTEWRCTTRPGKLYLHLFQWPRGKFELRGVQGTIKKAYFLCDPERKGLELKQEGGRVTLGGLPEKAPGEIATVICLEL